jgi:hypothetical protein
MVSTSGSGYQRRWFSAMLRRLDASLGLARPCLSEDACLECAQVTSPDNPTSITSREMVGMGLARTLTELT